MKLRILMVVVLIIIAFSAAMGFAQSPQIISTIPAQNELNVSVSTNIAVTFNMDIDAATINDSTFKVNGIASGPHSGNITYDVPSRTATFDAIDDFEAGEMISVVLTSGIQSTGGLPLLNGYVWLFTTDTEKGTAIFAYEQYYSTEINLIRFVKGISTAMVMSILL